MIEFFFTIFLLDLALFWVYKMCKLKGEKNPWISTLDPIFDFISLSFSMVNLVFVYLCVDFALIFIKLSTYCLDFGSYNSFQLLREFINFNFSLFIFRENSVYGYETFFMMHDDSENPKWKFFEFCVQYFAP